MNSESDRARKQAEKSFKKKASPNRSIPPDYETRASDVRQKMQYLRSLRIKLEKERSPKPDQ
jgi:hypothetical protein